MRLIGATGKGWAEPANVCQGDRKSIMESSKGAAVSNMPTPNTYEAPGCQRYPLSGFFAFFPPGGCQHRGPSATCSDLVSHAGAPTWLHQTPLEVRSPCA